MPVPYNNRTSLTRRRKAALQRLEADIKKYEAQDKPGKLENARECAVNLYKHLR